jgi:hypothetical protein
VTRPDDWPDGVPWPFEVKGKRGAVVSFDGTVYEVFGYSEANRYHVAEPRVAKELARGIGPKGAAMLCRCALEFDQRELPQVQYLLQLIAHYRAKHPLTER